MSTIQVITDVPDDQLNFVRQLLAFQGATTTVTRVGAGWTVTATFPDAHALQKAESITLPSPLATDTPEEAEPSFLPVAAPVKPPTREGGFAELAMEYRRNYDALTVNHGHEDEIALRVAKVRAGRDRYAALFQPTGIPWQFIGVLHMMESNCNFDKHLHNGDPLTERTRRVPAGRPPTGDKPFTWGASALDALDYEGFSGKTDWDVPAMLYRCERYNGMGYRSRGIHSPYLWSYCNLYQKGRFTGDHIFDPDNISSQCGAAILLQRLLAEA